MEYISLNDIKCVVCLEFKKNVYRCLDCRKIICSQCVEKSLKIRANCPHCRKENYQRKEDEKINFSVNYYLENNECKICRAKFSCEEETIKHYNNHLLDESSIINLKNDNQDNNHLLFIENCPNGIKVTSYKYNDNDLNKLAGYITNLFLPNKYSKNSSLTLELEKSKNVSQINEYTNKIIKVKEKYTFNPFESSATEINAIAKKVLPLNIIDDIESIFQGLYGRILLVRENSIDRFTEIIQKKILNGSYLHIKDEKKENNNEGKENIEQKNKEENKLSNNNMKNSSSDNNKNFHRAKSFNRINNQEKQKQYNYEVTSGNYQIDNVNQIEVKKGNIILQEKKEKEIIDYSKNDNNLVPKGGHVLKYRFNYKIGNKEAERMNEMKIKQKIYMQELNEKSSLYKRQKSAAAKLYKANNRQAKINQNNGRNAHFYFGW